MNLVIGGTGFLGREIACQLLERGQKVRTLSRREDDLLKEVESVRGETGFIVSVSSDTEGTVAETKIFRFIREKDRYSWTKVKKSDILLYSDVLAEVNCA